MSVDDWPRWRLGLLVGAVSIVIFFTTFTVVLRIRGIDYSDKAEPIAGETLTTSPPTSSTSSAAPTSTSAPSIASTTTAAAPAASTTFATIAPPPNSLAAQIAALPVADERREGYDRDLFEHWSDADHDGCNTRAEVLEAESLEPVSKNPNNCTVITGRWYSVYDGEEATQASDIDIDHVVALAEAWDSGAWQWDAARREAYANDLEHEFALIAVSDNSNQSKSDHDPAEWMPQASDRCPYLAAWVGVKTVWALSIDTAEKRALEAKAAGC